MRGVLLDPPRDRAAVAPDRLSDVIELAAVEARRWRQVDRMLREGGAPTAMARNAWQNLYNEDPRGLSSDGLTLASFTTSAPVFPTIDFPKNYFKTGRLINVRARGIWAATATPTYTFRLQNTVGTTVTLVTSAAITVSAITNQAWELDIDVQCRSEGTAGTLEAMGDLIMGGVSGQAYLPATGTAPATATVDTTIAQTWGVEIACSASNAANTVKGILLKLTVLN